LRRGRASLDQQLERLTEAYLGGVIPLPEYRRRRAEIEARHTALAEREARLSGEADRLNEVLGLAASLQVFCIRIATGLYEVGAQRVLAARLGRRLRPAQHLQRPSP
jgi:site-specific DNA recombinase